MNQLRPLVATPLLILAAWSLAAGPASAAKGPTDAVEIIRAQEAAVREAVLKMDFAVLERLWSEQFVVNTPRNLVAPDRATVFDVFRHGIAEYARYDGEIELLRIEGDIAIVMGSETVEPFGTAPLAGQTIYRRYTHIWQRQGDTWILIARHANIARVD